ncbi:MAG TPA: flagellar hook-basal body complex protein FliE [Devosia sp.]|nr:flagellar hook-basal body complex protein FliE [Devosia sp.]
MSTSISAAATAYGDAARLLQDSAKGGTSSGIEGGAGADFSSMLAESVQGVVESGNRADQVSMDMVNGNGSVVDVVTAVAETELAVETMVTVRDRVISAYEEIMRMPI